MQCSILLTYCTYQQERIMKKSTYNWHRTCSGWNDKCVPKFKMKPVGCVGAKQPTAHMCVISSILSIS